MSHDFTHDQLRAMLASEALHSEGGAEGEAVRAHVAACQACAAELEGYREATAQLAFLAPSEPMSAAREQRVRERLLSRAGAARDTDRPPRPVRAAPRAIPPTPDEPGIGPPTDDRMRDGRTAIPRRFGGGGWLAAAASIMVLLGTLSLYVAQRRELRDLRARAAAMTVAQQALTSGLASRDSLIEALTGPQVEIVQLVATGDRAPSARMFWSRATDRWTLVGHDFGAPPEGRTYQLWLITTTSATPIAAGTFAPDSSGSAVHAATFPLDDEALVAVAVSEEPAGGSPQPTTQPFLVGRARGE
jgi:anti-sigma-K factor RskA